MPFKKEETGILTKDDKAAPNEESIK